MRLGSGSIFRFTSDKNKTNQRRCQNVLWILKISDKKQKLFVKACRKGRVAKVKSLLDAHPELNPESGLEAAAGYLQYNVLELLLNDERVSSAKREEYSTRLRAIPVSKCLRSENPFRANTLLRDPEVAKFEQSLLERMSCLICKLPLKTNNEGQYLFIKAVDHIFAGCWDTVGVNCSSCNRDVAICRESSDCNQWKMMVQYTNCNDLAQSGNYLAGRMGVHSACAALAQGEGDDDWPSEGYDYLPYKTFRRIIQGGRWGLQFCEDRKDSFVVNQEWPIADIRTIKHTGPIIIAWYTLSRLGWNLERLKQSTGSNFLPTRVPKWKDFEL